MLGACDKVPFQEVGEITGFYDNNDGMLMSAVTGYDITECHVAHSGKWTVLLMNEAEVLILENMLLKRRISPSPWKGVVVNRIHVFDDHFLFVECQRSTFVMDLEIWDPLKEEIHTELTLQLNGGSYDFRYNIGNCVYGIYREIIYQVGTVCSNNGLYHRDLYSYVPVFRDETDNLDMKNYFVLGEWRGHLIVVVGIHRC